MKKFREFQLEVNINSSKEEVWDLLFNRFGEVNLFNPVLKGSHHTEGVEGEVGCERQCDINSRTSIQERIIAARGNDSFDIIVIKGGMPMMDEMNATWDFKEIGMGQTRARVTMRFTTKPVFVGALMKGMMAKMVKSMLIGLKNHIETGCLVTKENIKGIMKDYKQLNENEAFISSLAKEKSYGVTI
jgi:ribosome-associated toxin RatA of RatAB toxin-antitoxin module